MGCTTQGTFSGKKEGTRGSSVRVCTIEWTFSGYVCDSLGEIVEGETVWLCLTQGGDVRMHDGVWGFSYKKISTRVSTYKKRKDRRIKVRENILTTGFEPATFLCVCLFNSIATNVIVFYDR